MDAVPPELVLHIVKEGEVDVEGGLARRGVSSLPNRAAVLIELTQ